tara:strand:- start:590 stop:886 length:297 start_codon:yes stop_codon:yes gene_type:complete
MNNNLQVHREIRKKDNMARKLLNKLPHSKKDVLRSIYEMQILNLSEEFKLSSYEIRNISNDTGYHITFINRFINQLVSNHLLIKNGEMYKFCNRLRNL